MKEGTFLLLIFLSVISVCQNKASYGYSPKYPQGENYNFACVNAVAVANRAFYQLANNLKHQISPDVVYSDLDSIYGLSYYLDSTCFQNELTLTVQGDQNPACRKLFKLINLSLNQNGLDSFVNDYEKGINLSLQALRLGRSLNNDCKVKLVQKGEYIYDFDNQDILDAVDENIDKQISRTSKYLPSHTDTPNLDLDEQDEDLPVQKPKRSFKKPSTISSGPTNVDPVPKVDQQSSPQEQPKNSWFPQKPDSGFGFLGSQNSPSLTGQSDTTPVGASPNTAQTASPSQPGFGQTGDFMGNNAKGASSGSSDSGDQFGASQYYQQYYQSGGDPSDYNKYIQGSNAETQKDPSLLAAYHQNLAKTLNDESKEKYNKNSQSPDYSSQWQQFVGNYTNSQGGTGDQSSPYPYQDYVKYENNNKDFTDDAENGEYIDFLEEEQIQGDDSDSIDLQEIQDLKDELNILGF